MTAEGPGGRRPAEPAEPAGAGEHGGKRFGRRSGLTRFELVVTVFVVVLAVAGLAALVPMATGGSSATKAVDDVVKLNDAELAGPRAEAALQPCPTATPGAGAPAGELAGIEVPCLGAPGTVDLAAALAGRETLLNIWASWCVPCKEELPALQAYSARPDAVPVLGVNLKDNPVQALELLTKLKIHLPMVVDSVGGLNVKLKTVAVPASFLVRPDGSVTQLLPQVAYTEAFEVADAVAATRARAGK